jgi:hypothetical protein
LHKRGREGATIDQWPVKCRMPYQAPITTATAMAMSHATMRKTPTPAM